MEEAALKLVFNECVGPRPMDRSGRAGVEGWVLDGVPVWSQ